MQKYYVLVIQCLFDMLWITVFNDQSQLAGCRTDSCERQQLKKKKTSLLHNSAVTSSISNNLFLCAFSICPYKFLKGNKNIEKPEIL